MTLLLLLSTVQLRRVRRPAPRVLGKLSCLHPSLWPQFFLTPLSLLLHPRCHPPLGMPDQHSAQTFRMPLLLPCLHPPKLLHMRRQTPTSRPSCACGSILDLLLSRLSFHVCPHT